MTALTAEPSSHAVRDALHADLALVRDVLGMEVAMLTEVVGQDEIARWAEGGWGALESLEGGQMPFAETFCAKLLDGEIENFIGDAAHDERVQNLLMARALGVGSWLGVPVRAPGGRQFVLCCASREPHPGLGEPDVAILHDFLLRILPRLHAALTAA